MDCNRFQVYFFQLLFVVYPCSWRLNNWRWENNFFVLYFSVSFKMKLEISLMASGSEVSDPRSREGIMYSVSLKHLKQNRQTEKLRF